MLFYESERSDQHNYLYCQRDHNFNFPAHLHHSFEFLCVQSGTLACTLETEQYEVHPGEALLVALVLAFVIRTFVVQAYKIPSESMVETLLVGDHLLASKFAYGIKIPFTHTYIYRGDDPAYGDIIIFEYPNDPSVDYIKRVIGLPGDVITVRDKRLYRNGMPVEESYIRYEQPNIIEPIRDNFGPVTVPPDKYFVMGDNRNGSSDSRDYRLGTVDTRYVIGKAAFLIFPGPDYETEKRDFKRIGVIWS